MNKKYQLVVKLVSAEPSQVLRKWADDDSEYVPVMIDKKWHNREAWSQPDGNIVINLNDGDNLKGLVMLTDAGNRNPIYKKFVRWKFRLFGLGKKFVVLGEHLDKMNDLTRTWMAEIMEVNLDR